MHNSQQSTGTLAALFEAMCIKADPDNIFMIDNRACQIVSAWITAGNISDVSMMKALLLRRNLQGKVYGDKGYISSEKIIFTAA